MQCTATRSLYRNNVTRIIRVKGLLERDRLHRLVKFLTAPQSWNRNFFSWSSLNDKNGTKIGNSIRKMSIPSTIDDLTEVCMELRRVVKAKTDEKDKEAAVLKHIKTYADTGLKINDFAKGIVVKHINTCNFLLPNFFFCFSIITLS